MGRGVTIALAASLAANVFFGGFVAGRLTTGDTIERDFGGPGAPRRAGGGPPSRALGQALSLSDNARAAVREAIRPDMGEIRRDRRRSLELRRAVRDALSAEPFDREEARAALQEMMEFHSSREERRTDLLLTVFESLPPDERKEIVAAFSDRQTRRRGRRFRRDEERATKPPH